MLMFELQWSKTERATNVAAGIWVDLLDAQSCRIPSGPLRVHDLSVPSIWNMPGNFHLVDTVQSR